MTTIEYKGVVTTVEAGHSAVIRCEGDKMEDEVVIIAGGDNCTGEHVITVASVDDLPTDSADGTIAIVEG